MVCYDRCMGKLHYTIDIQASKEKVWQTMLDLDTYKQWAEPFYPGSYYDGSWEKGSEIKFLAEFEGKFGGVYGKIAESKLYEYVSVEYFGEVVDGQVITDSPTAKRWHGAFENYTFTENNGVVTVDVELIEVGMDPESVKMFDDMWPKALAKLKALCEA